jgi:transposase
MRITMGWDAATRRHYGVRVSTRANCLRDDEWSLILPFMPPPQPRGRPRETSLRTVVDAILYIAWTGCQWRALPSCFPPVSTVQRYFYRWRDDGTLRTINLHLVMFAREAKGREASPSAGVIDSQSAKTTDVAGPRGFDAGKKVMGRKRHILTDTEGHLLAAQVHTADIQDRDGAAPLLTSVRGLLPWLRHIFADGGYAGPKLEAELAGNGCWDLEIVRRWTPPKASSCYRDDGWSSAPSRFSAAAGVSPKTSKPASPAPKHGYLSPLSASSSAG